jgi:hypothetical protein
MKAHGIGCAAGFVALLLLPRPGNSQTSEPSGIHPVKPSALGETTWTRFEARPGSKVRIEGISTRSDWQVESRLIGGFLEVGPNFPTTPGQSVRLGRLQARAEVFVPVHSLKSVEKGGQPFSDEMDHIMYEKFAAQDDPRAKITYNLTELVLREIPKSKDEPYVFDSKGALAIAAVTNAVTMPLNVLPLGNKKLKISGTTSIKMTDYKIQPPTPKLSFGPLKTGDEVKLIFEWVLAQKAAARSAGAE